MYDLSPLEPEEESLPEDERELDEVPVAIILLGAEGVAELRGEPWIREATPHELETLERSIQRPLSDLLVDDTGRPYWTMALLPSAPLDKQRMAEGVLRILRL